MSISWLKLEEVGLSLDVYVTAGVQGHSVHNTVWECLQKPATPENGKTMTT